MKFILSTQPERSLHDWGRPPRQTAGLRVMELRPALEVQGAGGESEE